MTTVQRYSAAAPANPAVVACIVVADAARRFAAGILYPLDREART
jgi:hypothetical protein